MVEKQNNPIWTPSQKLSGNSALKKYIEWIEKQYGFQFKKYSDVWKWSIDNVETFWSSLFSYFNISFSGHFTSVIKGEMPKVRWFVGVQLSYAEHIFKGKSDEKTAIHFYNENGNYEKLTWFQLKYQTAVMKDLLIQNGVAKGDCVAGYLPTIPEATIAFLACSSIGAIWTSCSMDFGKESVVDRFAQIKPKVLLFADGYRYNGRPYNRIEVIQQIISELPFTKCYIQINYLDENSPLLNESTRLWQKPMYNQELKLDFERVDFSHPIYVLYSSGTTGKPKAITHSTGGILLEHLKYLSFHNDCQEGERFFWFTTTGWMMWNYLQSVLLVGAEMVLYEGSPTYPSLNRLWEICDQLPIHHFGTSAPFLLACKQHSIRFDHYDFSELKSISSTGAPLPPEGFQFVYNQIKKDIWFCSMSGGTDVCSAFVGGNPLLPVFLGEIQCRALGCALEAWDEKGNSLYNEVGEMVITKPMPSMPIYFWGDNNAEKYKESYFEMFPKVWRHGDWVKITNNDGIVILGRSDATLNRHGIRIGTAEIYRVVENIEGIKDSLIVNIEKSNGQHYMPLFIVLNNEFVDVEKVKAKIKVQLKLEYSPRHVPDDIHIIHDIPYTKSGKKMEAPVKKLITKMTELNSTIEGVCRNPESLLFFSNFASEVK